jgi:hypothetical protein
VQQFPFTEIVSLRALLATQKSSDVYAKSRKDVVARYRKNGAKFNWLAAMTPVDPKGTGTFKSISMVPVQSAFNL